MTRVQREGQQVDYILKEEQRAREERSLRYETERHHKEDEEEDENADMDQHQYMAAHVWNQDDDMRQSIEHSNLFDLDDFSLEEKLELLNSPIADLVEEVRRL